MRRILPFKPSVLLIVVTSSSTVFAVYVGVPPVAEPAASTGVPKPRSAAAVKSVPLLPVALSSVNAKLLTATLDDVPVVSDVMTSLPLSFEAVAPVSWLLMVSIASSMLYYRRSHRHQRPKTVA